MRAHQHLRDRLQRTSFFHHERKLIVLRVRWMHELPTDHRHKRTWKYRNRNYWTATFAVNQSSFTAVRSELCGQICGSIAVHSWQTRSSDGNNGLGWKNEKRKTKLNKNQKSFSKAGSSLTLYPVSMHWYSVPIAGKIIRPLFLCSSNSVMPHVDRRFRSISSCVSRGHAVFDDSVGIDGSNSGCHCSLWNGQMFRLDFSWMDFFL